MWYLVINYTQNEVVGVVVMVGWMKRTLNELSRVAHMIVLGCVAYRYSRLTKLRTPTSKIRLANQCHCTFYLGGTKQSMSDPCLCPLRSMGAKSNAALPVLVNL